ncbi:hypothetical protein PUN28_002290 [Cardiocondyla obscurior]|uniref:Uncharacterized protein n=1 Tax=Cardiocondyla obscurior TaxID=286306 RepID=A0AAW2GTD8_9HYME
MSYFNSFRYLKFYETIRAVAKNRGFSYCFETYTGSHGRIMQIAIHRLACEVGKNFSGCRGKRDFVNITAIGEKLNLMSTTSPRYETTNEFSLAVAA